MPPDRHLLVVGCTLLMISIHRKFAILAKITTLCLSRLMGLDNVTY